MDNSKVQVHQKGPDQPLGQSQSVVAVQQGRAGPELMHDLEVLGPLQPLGSLVGGAGCHLGPLMRIVDQVAQLPDHQDVLICTQHCASLREAKP